MKKRWWLLSSIAAVLFLVLIFGPATLTASGAEPALCASCHTMQEFADSHRDSKHTEVSCSQCHLPHEFGAGLAKKYERGFAHLWKTVTGPPDEISLRPQDAQLLLDNCIACHINTDHVKAPENRGCINCHFDDPHGDREDRR